MPRIPRTRMIAGLAGAAALAGVLGGTLLRADATRRLASPIPLAELTRLEPIRVLPRAELVLMAVEARMHLEAGRPWAAWRVLQESMDDPAEAPASAVLLAARAAGEWGGWRHVPGLLEGRVWLDEQGGGEGWLLLARAREQLGEEEAAAEAYRRYLRVPGAARAGVAQARLGGVLREMGEPRAAAEAFAAARAGLPEIDDWLHALQLEQLAEAGAAREVTAAARAAGGSPAVRARRAEAEATALAGTGDRERALRRLAWEAEVLRAQGARAEAAGLELERARLLRDAGRADEARPLLAAVAGEAEGSRAVRLAAAELLEASPGAVADEALARAAAYEAAEKPGLAARAVRSAISAGAADDGAVRLKLARLLYAERDYGPARAVFQEAAERLREPELVAEARLLAARSLYRGSRRDRGRAVAEFHEVAERHPGTAAAGSALFLLGDEASTTRAALDYYRRAAEVRHSPDAREALYRAGDRALRLKDTAGAARAWAEYVQRYPRGDQTARVAYEAGRIHARAGRASQARAMYAAAIAAEPVSYYALRAAERAGVHPLDGVLGEPRPWVGLATDPVEAANLLRRLDALESAGLAEERQAELDAAIRAFRDRPAAMLALAEGLRDRRDALQGIRLGYRLLETRGGEWDARLLRLVFPFPYREVLEREADRYDVDPMLLAALVRQESTFRPEVRSWVGATGLSQIMPATGRWLAPSVGIRNYDERLLTVPEVNLRMGAKYIGDLLDRYDGAKDLALAGYNAGPGRADRWRRTLGHGGDPDVFRDRIPFDETRHYVKVVLRNEAIYRRLYGAGD